MIYYRNHDNCDKKHDCIHNLFTNMGLRLNLMLCKYILFIHADIFIYFFFFSETKYDRWAIYQVNIIFILIRNELTTD